MEGRKDKRMAFRATIEQAQLVTEDEILYCEEMPKIIVGARR